MSRPVGTADELERRRKQAVQAVTDGQSRVTVAQVLGVHYKTVARWVRAARKPGGLAAKPQPAPAAGLTDADLRTLEGLLATGANQSGCCSTAPPPGGGLPVVADAGCCGPAPATGADLHGRLADLLRRYDVNDYAASVRVFAVKPG